MTSPLVTPMTPSDLEDVLEVDVDAFHEPREVRASQLRDELARPWARLRVVREAPASPSVGYILFWHVADEAHLINVAVAASARRRGLGRVLVLELLSYARANAVAKILLEVRASNAPAIALYESLGFSRFNVRARYYNDGEDAIEMMLTL